MNEIYRADVHVKKGKQRKIIATVKTGNSKKADRFDKEAEIRERRISIVFKVIYVIAAFFAAMFTMLAGSYANGLTDTYILFACADGFLLCLLIYMLVYIFNELKCLKLNADALSVEQHKRTEDAYSFIFLYFSLGSVIAIICGCIVGYYRTAIVQEWISYVMGIAVPVAAVLGNQLNKKVERVCSCISSILWTIAAIGILIGIAMK